MILAITRMKVLPDKRIELSQTIDSLSGSIKLEKGCKSCDFCQSINDENSLYLLEKWDGQESHAAHLKSDYFRVIKGAMSLLKEPYEMTFYTASGNGADGKDFIKERISQFKR
jgi:quinol monooxygenase YgiN